MPRTVKDCGIQSMPQEGARSGGGSGGVSGDGAAGLQPTEEILRSLRQIMRAVDLHSRRLSSEYGLTGPQLVTLQELRRRGSTSASVLARAIHLSGPTMTGILKRLENRELITRERSLRDRRNVEVRLTEAGRNVLERAPSPLQERFLRELDGLEEFERLQILATLKRVAAMMDAECLPVAPHLVAGAIEAPVVPACREESADAAVSESSS